MISSAIRTRMYVLIGKLVSIQLVGTMFLNGSAAVVGLWITWKMARGCGYLCRHCSATFPDYCHNHHHQYGRCAGPHIGRISTQRQMFVVRKEIICYRLDFYYRSVELI